MPPAKKILLYFAVFLITLVTTYALLYFFLGRNKQPEPVTISVQGLWDEDTFSTVTEEFKKENPEVTIEYQQKSLDNYYSNLAASLPNSNGPDLFWWHSTWGPELVKSLAPLPSSTMSPAEYEKTFYPITKSNLKWQDSYHGFPLEIDGLALLYNKSIFASTNFPQPPQTWTSLEGQYVPSLTKGDKKQILNSAIALGSAANVENFSEIIGLLMLQRGVVFTKDGKLVLNSNISDKGINIAASSLDFYTSFSRTSRTWDNTLPNSIEAFAKGQTAMIILPAYKIHDLLAYTKKENLSLDFAVAPVPQLPGSDIVNWGSYWSLGVSAQSPKKEQAASWKLAKYLISKQALQQVFAEDSKNHNFGRAYPRVDMASELTTHPYLAAYVASAPTAKSWFLHPDTNDKLNQELIAEFKKSVTELESSSGSSTGLKDLEKGIAPILKKYNLIL